MKTEIKKINGKCVTFFENGVCFKKPLIELKKGDKIVFSTPFQRPEGNWNMKCGYFMVLDKVVAADPKNAWRKQLLVFENKEDYLLYFAGSDWLMKRVDSSHTNRMIVVLKEAN